MGPKLCRRAMRLLISEPSSADCNGRLVRSQMVRWIVSQPRWKVHQMKTSMAVTCDCSRQMSPNIHETERKKGLVIWARQREGGGRGW